MEQNDERVAPDERSAWGRLALAISIVVCGFGFLLLCLTLLHASLDSAAIQALDRQGMQRIHAWTPPPLTLLMLALTTVGRIEVFAPCCAAAALLLLLKRRRHEALLLALAVASGILVNTLLKLHFHRLRPALAWSIGDEKTFSFPSGHSMSAVVVYGIFAYLLWPRVKPGLAHLVLAASAAAMAIAIGLSRMYLGMHYPSDVLAGWFTGLIWLGVIIAVDRGVSR